jgi:hypothetical protein
MRSEHRLQSSSICVIFGSDRWEQMLLLIDDGNLIGYNRAGPKPKPKQCPERSVA